MQELTYWDYIELDRLMSLQKNKQTGYPDEMIFIVYHQVCELYFKLIIQEIELIQSERENPRNWLKRLDRISNYFEILTYSFNVMSPTGLDTEEFFLFRKALQPASGFQTKQFRAIEIMFTDLINLIVDKSFLSPKPDIFSLYENIYWKQGALNLDGTKTKLLINFEDKYDNELKNLALSQQENNLLRLFYNQKNSIQNLKNTKFIDMIHIKLLQLDNVICNWKINHFETVSKHFQKFHELELKYNQAEIPSQDDIKGTGQTNSHQFLTASIKVIHYFPVK